MQIADALEVRGFISTGNEADAANVIAPILTEFAGLLEQIADQAGNVRALQICYYSLDPQDPGKRAGLVASKQAERGLDDLLLQRERGKAPVQQERLL